jgi:hypothetical protein
MLFCGIRIKTTRAGFDTGYGGRAVIARLHHSLYASTSDLGSSDSSPLEERQRLRMTIPPV